MKITRRQLRRIIEASIIKKDDDYTIPVEEPIEDPLKDLDYDEDQKSKIKNLALSDDQETKVHADYLADIGGFEDDDERFGIDSFSDQVTLTQLDINKLLKDPDLYSLLDEAADYWVHMNQEDIVDFDTINNSSTYAEFARNVILDDPNAQNSDAHQLKPVIVDIALDKLTMTGLDKYSKIMDLFSTSGIAFVDNLIYDALELNGSLYELYKDWKQYYMSGERDIPKEELTPELKAKFANIKEGRR